jgi:molybdate transport system substrate-binding protein
MKTGNIMNFFFLAAAAAVLLLISACTPQDVAPAAPPLSEPILQEEIEPGEIVVAAASDLQFAFTEISQIFEEQTGSRVTLVFGSTGHLTQQIENGAPYDLLASASADYIQRLLDQGLVLEDSVQVYAYGRLVIAVNRGSGLTVASLEDLLLPGVRTISIANPSHAPYGIAARQALESAGVWDQLQTRLVLGENVRQAVQYVQSGDAQAGLVAISVASVPEVSWIMVDRELHEPIEQVLAVTMRSKRPDIASQFARFVLSEKSQQILFSYGFEPPIEAELLPTPVQ